MRVEELLIPGNSGKRESIASDFLNRSESAEETKEKAGFGPAVKKSSDDRLSVSVKDPVYDKGSIKEKTALDKLKDRENNGLDENWQQNQMVLVSETMSEEEYSKMEEDGFDPKKAKPKEFVTIADKIRLQLAKGGADISMTGDISDEALEQMAGSEAGAAAAKQVLAKAAELPDT
ncbi:MAG: hypothetical protein K6F00_10605, partial [Lachnospiraceae bacterium]|nr:hypothetical protein [Lachnospiraceae bacterium]